MPNENCLKGMRCPKCKSEGPFKIAATCWAEVHDNGIESSSDFEWGPKDSCMCFKCSHDGVCGDFYTVEQP